MHGLTWATPSGKEQAAVPRGAADASGLALQEHHAPHGHQQLPAGKQHQAHHPPPLTKRINH